MERAKNTRRHSREKHVDIAGIVVKKKEKEGMQKGKKGKLSSYKRSSGLQSSLQI